jgi:polysaccharide deacetylase family protein (PEP-CTERM system associated)
MSVDVEEYFQVWALADVVATADWDRWPSRVEASTRRTLELFAAAGVRATFFVLGWVAERRPQLVRAVVAAGHELASHGYGHAKVTSLEPAAFRADVARAKAMLEDAAGVAVTGYRAPSFSIGPDTWWAYDVLADTGHRYSSSLHPIRHDHYGLPNAPRTPFRPLAGPLVEVPVATLDLGVRVSCAGGGHFRLLPYPWTRWCLDRLTRTERRPGVFYFHPWELDPGQPRVAGLPWRARLRHYTNLDAMEAKLRRLLRDFAWDRLDAVVPLDPAALPRWAPETAAVAA